MNARELTRHMGGHWHDRYGMVRCPVHDDRTASLQISNRPNGSLWATCHAGCDSAEVRRALRDLGATDGPALSPDEAARRERAARAETQRNQDLAWQLWADAVPARGTIVEAYLRNRGLTYDPAWRLRFAPRCKHGPSGKRLPAMLARVDHGGEGRTVFALQRTFLVSPGWKAPIDSPKMGLGPVRGGAVRLVATGAVGRLLVAEGIETALSAAQLLGDPAMNVWAVLGTTGMTALRLPKALPGYELVIAADGDDAGRKAAEALGARADRDGWRVKVARAPEGRDWNDVLMAQGVAS